MNSKRRRLLVLVVGVIAVLGLGAALVAWLGAAVSSAPEKIKQAIKDGAAGAVDEAKKVPAGLAEDAYDAGKGAAGSAWSSFVDVLQVPFRTATAPARWLAHAVND